MWGFRKHLENSRMIRRQIMKRGIYSPKVLRALESTDRVHFVPDELTSSAYLDQPVPLMPGATVSQPYMVALMTDLLSVRPHHRVLEIGTGSGYQAAVLSRMAREVWTVEMQEALVAYARDHLALDGVTNVHVIHGDGWQGYPDAAPYDRIIVTAAPGSVPEALLNQLGVGGRMIIPVGDGPTQELELIEKSADGQINRTSHSTCTFVPLVNSRES